MRGGGTVRVRVRQRNKQAAALWEADDACMALPRNCSASTASPGDM